MAQDRTAPPAPPPAPAADAARIGALLSNPAVQDGIATTVDQVADAMLQTRVGALAHVTDPRDAVRPDDTLGDLAARDHPDYRRDLHDSTRRAVAAVGHTAQDMASMSAELQRSAQRLRAVLARAQKELDAVQ